MHVCVGIPNAICYSGSPQYASASYWILFAPCVTGGGCGHGHGTHGFRQRHKKVSACGVFWVLATLFWDSGYCQVSSRSPTWHFMTRIVVWGDSKANASLIMKEYSRWPRAHLAVSTERVSFQTSEGAIVKIDFTFCYGPLWQPCKITSFMWH